MIKAAPPSTLFTPVFVPKWIYEFVPAGAAGAGMAAVYSPYATGSAVFFASLLMLYAAAIYAMRLLRW